MPKKSPNTEYNRANHQSAEYHEPKKISKSDLQQSIQDLPNYKELGNRFKMLYGLGNLSNGDGAFKIDQVATGAKLRSLRRSNEWFAKNVCFYSTWERSFSIYSEDQLDSDKLCQNNPRFACENCETYKKHMVTDYGNDISYNSLSLKTASSGPSYGLTSYTSQSLKQMEKGNSVTLSKILNYAFLAQVPITDIIVLKEPFYFDELGIIRFREQNISPNITSNSTDNDAN